MVVALLLAGLCASGLLAGCAVEASTGQSCDTTYNLRVSPTSATADHTLAAPGNQVKFASTITASAPAGCAAPAFALAVTPTWTSSDPKDIQLNSSSNGQTNGTATCVGSTNGAATITATTTYAGTTLTQTSSLTCK